MEDKRRFPRFESAFEVEYYPQGNDSISSYTISKNVSRGGISFPALSRFVKNGDIIKLEINTNDDKSRILAKGQVRWTRPLQRSAPLDSEVGIEFTKISPNDVERLVGFAS